MIINNITVMNIQFLNWYFLNIISLELIWIRIKKNKSLLPRIYERAGLTIGRYQDECAHSSAGLWKRLVWLVRSTAGSIFGKGRKNAVHHVTNKHRQKTDCISWFIFYQDIFGCPFCYNHGVFYFLNKTTFNCTLLLYQ